MATEVFFDWDSIEDIPQALDRHSVGVVGKGGTTTHLQVLDRVGALLQATDRARENAARLATGYDDLVVVLMAPSNSAEWVSYDEMKSRSPSLRLVDETLQLAFEGQRDLENTIILHRWPFRSDEIRGSETDSDRHRNNKIASIGSEVTLAHLRPKVILVCQCGMAGLETGEADEEWTCSLAKAGNHDLFALGRKYVCFRVRSFHPMHTEYTRGIKVASQQAFRRHLFEATFFVAANLLAGRSFAGNGIFHLQSCASGKPKPSSYTEADQASEGLIKQLRELSIKDFEKDARAKKLLTSYRDDYLRQCSQGI
jgi:hypothetical protein